MGLDKYAAKNIFVPLEMNDTRFLPPPQWLRASRRRNTTKTIICCAAWCMIRPRAAWAGVAGHAGVFSTADDLAKYAQDMLSGFHVLTPLTVEKMTTPQQPPTSTTLRGLGWDIDSPFSSARGEIFPVGSFGHTGFTGTSIWIDPVTDSYVILLTNAVHPHGHNAAIVPLRARVATAAAESLGLTVSGDQKLRMARITGYNETMPSARLVTARNGSVRTGIDVLESPRFRRTSRSGQSGQDQGCDGHQPNRRGLAR